MSFLLNTLLVKLTQEALLALVGRLPWAAIIERLVSRVVVAGLRKLASMSSNSLTQETVNDLIKSVESKELPELK